MRSDRRESSRNISSLALTHSKKKKQFYISVFCCRMERALVNCPTDLQVDSLFLPPERASDPVAVDPVDPVDRSATRWSGGELLGGLAG